MSRLRYQRKACRTESRRHAAAHLAVPGIYTIRCRRRSPSPGSSSFLQCVDTRQVAALFVVIHAETEYVAIGHFDADKIGFDPRRGTPMMFLAEHCNQYACGPLCNAVV